MKNNLRLLTQLGVFCLQRENPLFLSDLVQGQLFDLGQQLCLHFSETDTLFGDLLRGGNAREMFVGLDLLFDFGERPQVVVVGEYII